MAKINYWREIDANNLVEDKQYLKEKIQEIEKDGLTIKERLEKLIVKMKG